MIDGVGGWLRDSGAIAALTGDERALMTAPALSWPREVVIQLQAEKPVESVGALLWILGVIREMLPYDRAFDAEQVIRLLPFLSDSPFVLRPDMDPRDELAAMNASVEVRPSASIEGEEQRAGLWLWRARSELLLVRRGKLQRREQERILSEGRAAATRIGIATTTSGDFIARGDAYSALPDETIALLLSIATARVLALRWTLGNADWRDVPLDS